MSSNISLTVLMQSVLGPHLMVMAQIFKVCERNSPLNGSALAQVLVLSYLRKPLPVVSDLERTARALGINVTGSAIDQRFTPECLAFFRQALESVMSRAVEADRVVVPLLAKFSGGVEVQDSTTVRLPDAMAPQYRACNDSEGNKAAMKVQVRFDLARGGLVLAIEEGRSSDAKTPLQTADIVADSLHVRDLGYFDLDVLRHIQEKKAFFVSRLIDQTAVFVDGERVDLASFLARRTSGVVHLAVEIGANDRLPVWLVALRVPPNIAEERRRDANRKGSKYGHIVSDAKLELCDWNFYVTNAPPEKLTAEDVQALARMRWQIELLFKLWKSDEGLGQTRSTRPDKIGCEQFARMIGLVLKHWILVRSCWHNPKRSLRQAARVVREFGLAIASAFHATEQLAQILDKIADILKTGSSVAKRRKNPASHQVAANPKANGYKPYVLA